MSLPLVGVLCGYRAQSRSATDTLVSLKQFVRQLFVAAGSAVQSVFSWHHDDDKSFRGPVEEYVQSQG